jgi:hypothetical protein
MKRTVAAALLTAAVTAGAMMPVAAEWNGETEAACIESVQTQIPEKTAAAQETAGETGWRCIDGNWYLLREDGTRRQGWVREKGNWYFLNDRGIMVTGWNEIDGRIYCFGENGIMCTGETADYLLGLDGALAENEENKPPLDGIYVTILGIVRPA